MYASITTLTELLAENLNPSEEEVREAITGNLCRCTGYQPIIKAGLLAAERMRALGDEIMTPFGGPSR